MQDINEEQRFKMELIEKITRVETMLEAHLASDKEIRRGLRPLILFLLSRKTFPIFRVPHLILHVNLSSYLSNSPLDLEEKETSTALLTTICDMPSLIFHPESN